jgi:hypothetical protein
VAEHGRSVGRLRIGRAWWRHHVGRRGEFLLFLVILDVLYGASLARPPRPPLPPSTRFLAELMPLTWWALLWLAVGGVCLVGAFSTADRLAFAVAAALKVLWGSMFLAGWVAGVIERGWVGAVIWLVFAGWVVRLASWPEPGD